MAESDVCRCQILMYKDGLRADTAKPLKYLYVNQETKI